MLRVAGEVVIACGKTRTPTRTSSPLACRSDDARERTTTGRAGRDGGGIDLYQYYEVCLSVDGYADAKCRMHLHDTNLHFRWPLCCCAFTVHVVCSSSRRWWRRRVCVCCNNMHMHISCKHLLLRLASPHFACTAHGRYALHLYLIPLQPYGKLRRYGVLVRPLACSWANRRGRSGEIHEIWGTTRSCGIPNTLGSYSTRFD